MHGLGLLPCSNAVHYDKEPGRSEAYRAAIADGMASGYAVDDGAALHFVGTALARVVASRPAREAPESSSWAARWSSRARLRVPRAPAVALAA